MVEGHSFIHAFVLFGVAFSVQEVVSGVGAFQFLSNMNFVSFGEQN